MAQSTEEYLQCAQRVLLYISGTKDRGLLYRTGKTMHLVGYIDADWAGNTADRRSMFGYTFSLGSAAITWSSKKQPTIALSSTEAEYRGAVVATCEAIWLKWQLKDIQEEVSDPTTIYCDNLSSIQLAKNPVFHTRTKHIEVHYHFVHERVLSGEVELQYVPTDRQTADIFTKPLGLDKLRQFSGGLELRHLDVPDLRGRTVPKDRPREQERSGGDRDIESMTNSTLDRLKKPSADPRESPDADRKGAAEGGSRSQPCMGKTTPSRARRPKTTWRQPTRRRAKTDRRWPSRFG